MTTFLGLDVSPLRIGWAILDADKLKAHGTIVFESSEWVTPARRFEAIEDTLAEYDVTHVGIEAVFVGPNKLGSIRAAMALGQVEMVCDCIWPNSVQKVLTASQWRKHAGIEGGGKDSVMEWARAICEEDEVDPPGMQDAADAIAIAYATFDWFDADG